MQCVYTHTHTPHITLSPLEHPIYSHTHARTHTHIQASAAAASATETAKPEAPAADSKASTDEKCCSASMDSGKTLLDLAQTTADLSELVSAIKTKTSDPTSLTSTLGGKGPLTVMAPNNAAFKAVCPSLSLSLCVCLSLSVSLSSLSIPLESYEHPFITPNKRTHRMYVCVLILCIVIANGKKQTNKYYNKAEPVASKLTKDQFTELIKYHVIPGGAFCASDLANGTQQVKTALDGCDLTVVKDSSGESMIILRDLYA